MNESAASLSRLHDIVEPPPAPWWPAAPGWWILGALLAMGLATVALHWLRQWRANAYRREALRELARAKTPADISQVLKRAALAAAPRETIAALSTAEWPKWLAQSLPEAMPASVQQLLSEAMYQATVQPADLTQLRQYSRKWINEHQLAD